MVWLLSSDGNAVRYLLPFFEWRHVFAQWSEWAKIKYDALCFVQFMAARGQSLPSPTAFCYCLHCTIISILQWWSINISYARAGPATLSSSSSELATYYAKISFDLSCTKPAQNHVSDPFFSRSQTTTCRKSATTKDHASSDLLETDMETDWTGNRLCMAPNWNKCLLRLLPSQFHHPLRRLQGFHHRLYVFVCFFSVRYLKTVAARITKLGTVMFHDNSWKSLILGSKGHALQKVPACMRSCTLVSAGLF